MKNNSKLLVLLALATTYQFCNASDDALQDYANKSEEDFLKIQALYYVPGFESNSDDRFTRQDKALPSTLEAASHSQKKVISHTETCQDGKELIIIGASIFTFFQSWNVFNVPATSHYSDLKNSGIILGSTLGILCTTAGLIKYRLGISRLEKAHSKK